jgi:anti-sigma factor RsiW
MTCCELLDFIDDYLDGGLSPEVREVFEKHMGKCRPCKAYLDTYMQTVSASRGCCEDAVRHDSACDSLPAELVRAILAACGCKKSQQGGT